jgi:hypothetical protein
MSDLYVTVAGMVTPKGGMSTEGEKLQVSVLPCRCWICPVCCVCLGCCEANFVSSGGTYELPVYTRTYIYINSPTGNEFISLFFTKPFRMCHPLKSMCFLEPLIPRNNLWIISVMLRQMGLADDFKYLCHWVLFMHPVTTVI